MRKSICQTDYVTTQDISCVVVLYTTIDCRQNQMRVHYFFQLMDDLDTAVGVL